MLLALSLLSACAAADPGAQRSAAAADAAGAFGAYLTGRFAASQTDLDRAARDLLRAYAADPGNPELLQQTFLACLMDDRPEAARLAAQLPDNPAAQLLLADDDARAGSWDAAEQRFHALPSQGLTQLLRPLLVAWAQQGGGHADAALATLRPYVEGQRFRGVYALHAAMIADLAGDQAEAARLYHIAQTDYGGLNLRLAQILASWQARQGRAAEAQHALRALGEGSEDLSIAIPSLMAADTARPVGNASDGIAEAYLALAAALHQQDATEYALMLLQLALDMRPDFAAARLLMADILQSGGHAANAIAALAPVPPADPLAPVVRLRRAALEEQAGNTGQATRLLDQLAHDYPTRPEPLALKGDILRSQSRFADAVLAYDQAIARIDHPGRSAWPLFYDRGIALERSKQWPKAEADFEHALELSPDEPYVLNYLGYSWAEQGHNLTRARQMIERAQELRPNDGAIADSLGWVLLRQGDTAGAIRWLGHAVELDPEDSTINGHLGDAYWAVGRKLEAQYQWQLALSLKPQPDDVARLQAKLHEAETQNGTATAGNTATTGVTAGATTAGGATTAERRLP
ncbi:MAG: tetratricopeptide repeat protein [Acidisphaera sp.]|nr:tetratricopeptide repeat protein [Acidisphaera sp.]